MSSKRRRPSTTGDRGNARAKRIKFTFDIDDIHLPETDKNGAVLVTGAGDVGQLGLGPDILEKSRPFAVSLDFEIVDVCAGGMHTVCLTNDGKVITFGCNDEGALGRKTSDEDAEYSPGEVDLPEKVKQITAGDSHTAALLESGRVFAWGNFRDSHGGMGLTSKGESERLPYELMGSLSGGTPLVVKIASGADHIVMLTQHGTVYTCGCPEQGQLGRTTERSSSRNARSSYGTDQLGKFLTASPITLKPSLRLIFDDIWAGTYATFIRASHTSSGTSLKKPEIYVFGLNNYHQLGLATPQPQFTPKRCDSLTAVQPEQIVSGQHHTIIRDKEGKVFALGRKEYGRLGLGELCEDAMEPKQVDLGEDLVIWVSCGATTSFAVTETGQLYGWGMGGGGQLGTGQEEDCFKPTLITGKHVVGRKVFRVSGGGQHTVIIAADTTTTKPLTETVKVETAAVDVKRSSDKKVTKKKVAAVKKVNNGKVKGERKSKETALEDPIKTSELLDKVQSNNNEDKDAYIDKSDAKDDIEEDKKCADEIDGDNPNEKLKENEMDTTS